MAASREKVAQNYAQLKAYVASAGSHFEIGADGRGFPHKWGSLTDLLMTIWAHAKLQDASHSVGPVMAAHNATTRPLFWEGGTAPSAGTGAASGLGRLVDEYSSVMAELHERWSHGLGRYLLAHIEESMYRDGLLVIKKQVAKKEIYLNGKSLGLSGKKLAGLDDFAVPFELFAKRSGKILAQAGTAQPADPPNHEATPAEAMPPEYQGN